MYTTYLENLSNFLKLLMTIFLGQCFEEDEYLRVYSSISYRIFTESSYVSLSHRDSYMMRKKNMSLEKLKGRKIVSFES